jgi:hypothetical protein
MIISLAFCACFPHVALADEPIGFRRLRSSLGVGLSVSDWLLGDIGEVTTVGVGITIQETLQYSYFGFGVRLGFGYHLTNQPPLPFDGGFDSYHLAFGPRLNIPLTESMELTFQTEYIYQGLGSNTLILLTDLESNLHGVGLWTGLHVFLGPLLIEPAIQADYLPQIQTLILGGVLSVGVQNLL